MAVAAQIEEALPIGAGRLLAKLLLMRLEAILFC